MPVKAAVARFDRRQDAEEVANGELDKKLLEKAATSLDALRWIVHWPLSQVEVLRERFKSWYNPGMQCVELHMMPKSDFWALLVRAAGRPPLVPDQVAHIIADTFADEDEEVAVLEALTGLTMLCAGDISDKLRFIFDLFDEHSYGELVEDQVVAMCTVGARASTRLGEFIAPSSDAVILRWVGDLFQRLYAMDPQQRYPRLNFKVFQDWIASHRLLQRPFLLPECIYTFERLLHVFHTSLDQLPEEHLTASPHNASKNPLQAIDASQDPPRHDDYFPCWILQGPIIESRGVFKHFLNLQVSRPEALVKFHLSLLDVPVNSDLPNLVGYMPSSRWNRVIGHILRADKEGKIQVQLPDHLLPPGVHARVLCETYSRHSKSVCFVPGPAIRVFISLDENPIHEAQGQNGDKKLSMEDLVIVKNSFNRDYRFDLDQGKVCTVSNQEELLQEFWLSSGDLVLLVRPSQGAIHLLSADLREKLMHATGSSKLFFVMDREAPLLGHCIQEPLRNERIINEEILFALAEWQVAPLTGAQRHYQREVFIIVLGGRPCDAGWGKIIQAHEHGHAVFEQVVLCQDYEWSKLGQTPVLETTSLKEAFFFEAQNHLSQSVQSLRYFRTDELHQVKYPTLLFGPAVTHISPSSANIALSIDRPCSISVSLTMLSNYESVLFAVQTHTLETNLLHSFIFDNLMPQQTYAVHVRVGDGYILGEAEVCTPGSLKSMHSCIVNGAASEPGSLDSVFLCSAFASSLKAHDNTKSATSKTSEHTDVHPEFLKTLNIVHLGGWTQLEELCQLSTEEEAHAAMRNWVYARPHLQNMLRSCNNWVVEPPYHHLQPECARVVKSYLAPFAVGRGVYINDTTFMVGAANGSETGHALDELLYWLPGDIERIVVAIASPLSHCKDQGAGKHLEDAAEAIIRFMQALARRVSHCIEMTLVHPAPVHSAVSWQALIQDQCSSRSFYEVCIPPACADATTLVVRDNFFSKPCCAFGFENRFQRHFEPFTSSLDEVSQVQTTDGRNEGFTHPEETQMANIVEFTAARSEESNIETENQQAITPKEQQGENITDETIANETLEQRIAQTDSQAIGTGDNEKQQLIVLKKDPTSSTKSEVLFERKAYANQPRATRGSVGILFLEEMRIKTMIPYSEDQTLQDLSLRLQKAYDLCHESKIQHVVLQGELAKVQKELTEAEASLNELIKRMKNKRLDLFDERLAELRRLEKRKKDFQETSTSCMDAIQSLQEYYAELPQVKRQVPVKQAASHTEQHSLNCGTTQLILKIAGLCEEAHTALCEGANVITVNGEIRLKKDGSYAFSEDLTIKAFKRISKLFEQKISQLVKDDQVSFDRFRRLLERLHKLRGPALTKVGMHVNNLRSQSAELQQAIISLKNIESKSSQEATNTMQAVLDHISKPIALPNMDINSLNETNDKIPQ